MRKTQRPFTPPPKPPYNPVLGEADTTLVVHPPFSFPGVTARVFPLRASLDVLKGFYGSYLGVAPEICQLRPSLPCVLLVVLDYGRMAVEKANLGWVAQHEVFFAVPLEMWVRDRPGGRMTFRGWVVSTPFIFVDNASSLTTGREVYGWPKVLASMQPSVEGWLADPRNPTRLLSLSVEGFGSQDRQQVRLLDIDQVMAQSPSLLPLDLATFDPIEQLARLNRVSWAAAWDLGQLLMRPPLAGFGPSAGSEERSEVLFESLRQLAGFFRRPGVGVVTLKQFREAGDPDRVCYQSLVQSRLSVSRYVDGGLLGLYNLLQGDITGGYRIRLYDNPSFQIAESLGLEVAQEETTGGGAASILEPFFPSWMRVDLRYGKGETVCWRRRGQPWCRKKVAFSRGRKSLQSSYNTFAGAAQQEWSGPYRFPQAYCEVFPLEAYSDKLREFVRDYLSQEKGSPYSFEPWGSYVYMVVSAGNMFSLSRSDRKIAANEVSFYVPVRWLDRGDLKDYVFVRPFAFTDNPTVTMTVREVHGAPAWDATIMPYLQFWRSRGPVLGMQVDVFPALDAGLRSERRVLLEVVSKDSGSPDANLSPDTIRRLPPLPIKMLMLKQFRDAEDLDKACYKSLVCEPWKLSDYGSLQALGEGREVRIYRYPSLPLVETLGLKISSSETSPPRAWEGLIADVLEPCHPFRVELSIEVDLAEEISPMKRHPHWLKPSWEDDVQSEGPQAWIEQLFRGRASQSPGGAP